MQPQLFKTIYEQETGKITLRQQNINIHLKKKRNTFSTSSFTCNVEGMKILRLYFKLK